MRAEAVEEQLIPNVEVMPVEAFSLRPRCRKCGWRVGFWARFFIHGWSAQQWSYCSGNHDSTREVSDMFGRKREVEVTCAGVFEEHLHLQCTRCSFHWLMRTGG